MTWPIDKNVDRVADKKKRGHRNSKWGERGTRGKGKVRPKSSLLPPPDADETRDSDGQLMSMPALS